MSITIQSKRVVVDVEELLFFAMAGASLVGVAILMWSVITQNLYIP